MDSVNCENGQNEELRKGMIVIVSLGNKERIVKCLSKSVDSGRYIETKEGRLIKVSPSMIVRRASDEEKKLWRKWRRQLEGGCE